MSDEVQSPKRRKVAAKPFTPEQARDLILGKLEKAGAKGAASPVTASMPAEKRSVIEQTLTLLESEREIFVDRRKAKPKYFLWAVRPRLPSAESVADKIEQFATSQHPRVVTHAELKKQLAKDKESAPLLPAAIELLVSHRRLLSLMHGAGKKVAEVYAHGASLRTMLGENVVANTSGTESTRSPESTPALDPARVKSAYTDLAQRTGFPAVPISTLQRESGAPVDALKEWLLAEYKAGRAILSFGDWSLADEAKRAGAIEMNGEQYLLVRLLE